MPRPQREKDFPIFFQLSSSTKEKTSLKETSQAKASANISELTPTSQTTKELLFGVKSDRITDFTPIDISISTRLDTIDVALGNL